MCGGGLCCAIVSNLVTPRNAKFGLVFQECALLLKIILKQPCCPFYFIIVFTVHTNYFETNAYSQMF